MKLFTVSSLITIIASTVGVSASPIKLEERQTCTIKLNLVQDLSTDQYLRYIYQPTQVGINWDLGDVLKKYWEAGEVPGKCPYSLNPQTSAYRQDPKWGWIVDASFYGFPPPNSDVWCKTYFFLDAWAIASGCKKDPKSIGYEPP